MCEMLATLKIMIVISRHANKVSPDLRAVQISRLHKLYFFFVKF